MYKFDSIIETENIIPLSDLSQMDEALPVEYKLPISFYVENEKLFKEIRQVILSFKLLSKSFIVDKVNNNPNNHQSKRLLDLYDSIMLNGNTNNKEKLSIEDRDCILCLTNFEMKKYLIEVQKILVILQYVNVVSKDYYSSLHKAITRLIHKINATDAIFYTTDGIRIPKTWYITKNGELYNCMGFVYGHKESDLELSLRDIDKKLLANKCICSRKGRYKEEFDRVKENGFVTLDQFTNYLNLSGRIKTISGRIYNPLINRLVLGIIQAHHDLYEAYERFNEVKNKKEELEKLKKLVNNSLDDLFVKFLGMSKIGPSLVKEIYTTNTATADFKEYEEHGYNVELVNPIEIQDGKIKEKDISYINTVRKMWEK